MKTEKVTCDGCGRDLTTRTNCEDYRLVLASESKPGYGAGAYTAMAIRPAINQDHHFCYLGCLDLWRDRVHHRDRLMSDWLNAWRQQHSTGNAYPSIPETERQERLKEFQEAALLKFPMRIPR